MAGLGSLALIVAVSPAGASPMRSPHPARATRSHALPANGTPWSRFLSGGPALWAEARPPRIPSGLHLLTHNGQLVATPFVEYLSWRRSLSPARFDHYHRVVGPELGMLLPPPTVPTSTPIAGGISQGGPPALNPQPENGAPEPGALTMAFTLIAAGLWYRRRVGRLA